MYLALLPDEETKSQILAACPTAKDLHLTVIHSKLALPKKGMPAVTHPDFPFSVGGTGIATFGGAKKVLVAKLALTYELIFLRKWAEKLFIDNSLELSSEWAFSPHVTLCGVGETLDAAKLPTLFTFNRAEWRP